MYAKGYVAQRTECERRLRNGNVLTTRTGEQGIGEAADIVEINLKEFPHRAVHPSTESACISLSMERPDIGAVVHAHPPFATGFATAREALDDACSRGDCRHGGIPLAPRTPSRLKSLLIARMSGNGGDPPGQPRRGDLWQEL